MGGKPSTKRQLRPSVPPPPPHNTPPPVRHTPPAKFSRIGDDYKSLEEVTQALRQAGLESSNLIVGVDFTGSNESSGRLSFNGKSLHHISGSPNPYEQAISIIGKTLSSFDDDNEILCYGFGDVTTGDKEVFSFNPDGTACIGFEEVLARYRELARAPQLRLYGPTSFAPIIEMAIGIVENSGGQYHVLLIIADGQVTQPDVTIKAIVEASKYPLSIVVVGVGDGPWGMMETFDDSIPARAFDNFQFVNLTEIMSRNTPAVKKETEFALAALMEIPAQYKATMELGLLSKQRGTTGRTSLPPPDRKSASASFNRKY